MSKFLRITVAFLLFSIISTLSWRLASSNPEPLVIALCILTFLLSCFTFGLKVKKAVSQ